MEKDRTGARFPRVGAAIKMLAGVSQARSVRAYRKVLLRCLEKELAQRELGLGATRFPTGATRPTRYRVRVGKAWRAR